MKKQLMCIAMFTIFTLTNSYSKNNQSTIEITIRPQMKEQILRSPFKVLLKKKDGHEFMAYLFAEDEKKERHFNESRHGGNLRSWILREGHYFLYLYDIKNNSFLPYKTSILNDFETLIFNSEGSRIVVLPGSQEGKSDVLLIGQFGTGSADFYEAYGFLDNKPYLQHYIFSDKRIQFTGAIYESKNKINSQINAWGILHDLVTLSLSDKPGIILIKSRD